MSDVIKLVPKGDEPDRVDEILEAMKGCGAETLVVISQMPDGTMQVVGNQSVNTTVVMLELAKHTLLFGDHE